MPTRPPDAKGEKCGPGEYREAKGFSIYAIGSDDIVQIASWHQIQNAEEFARDLNIAASRDVVFQILCTKRRNFFQNLLRSTCENSD